MDRGTRGKNGKVYNEDVLVSCGTCKVCKDKLHRQWSFRLKQQEKVSSTSLFVTLTYNTNTVPISESGFMSLRKKDLQNFFKRLRKLQKEPIKYYAVGEYGTINKRPHYHIILFGAIEYNVHKAWYLDNQSIGNIHIGKVEHSSIAYTLKYVNKAIEAIPEWKKIEHPFQLTSQGIGLNYLTPQMIEYHQKDIERNYAQDGEYKVPLPRYYRDKIYSDKQKSSQAQIAQKKSLEHDKELKKLIGDKDIVLYKREIRVNNTDSIKNYSQRKL